MCLVVFFFFFVVLIHTDASTLFITRQKNFGARAIRPERQRRLICDI